MGSGMSKILLVEDEQDLSDMVVDLLSVEHHIIEQAFTGIEGSDRMRLYEYDLIILDWELPGKSGIEIIKEFRLNGGVTPVLFLTGKNLLPDKIEGFNEGADDYMTKPYQAEELIVRVQALLRRPKTLLPKTVKFRHLELDIIGSKTFSQGTEVKLLPKEFALLVFLVKNKGHAFDHNAILNRVWSSESDASNDAIMTCVKRIRKKLDIDGQPSVITTVHGIGYRADD